MVLYLVSRGNLGAVRGYLDEFLPPDVRAIPVSDDEAGTLRKDEILETATHVLVIHPGTGGLSLIFATLARPVTSHTPRLMVVSERSLDPLLEYGEPAELERLKTRQAEGSVVLGTGLDLDAFTQFLGRDVS